MVTYDDLKEYLYELAYARIYMGGAATRKDVGFLIGRIVYTLKRKHAILPYKESDLDDFVRLEINEDFCNVLLGDCLGEFNGNLKELYHVGNLKDIMEKWFQIKLNSKIIGLYKKNLKVYCECGEQAVFVKRDKIQSGKEGYIYYCQSCGNMVGVHVGTNIPFGIPADKETRALRIKCHQLFDQKWNTPEEREEMYLWLMEKMGLNKAQTHFGKFNKTQCREALKILSARKDGYH